MSTNQPSLITRFAPTPSGYVHMGNALAFIMTWLLARKAGGKIHLRIDDLDAPRMSLKYVEDVFVQLEWLGLDYDSGPTGPDDVIKRHSQTLKLDRYAEGLQRLQEFQPSPIYACDCSRTKVRHDSGGESLAYPGTCRSRALPFVAENSLRLRLPDGGAVAFQEWQAGPCAVDLTQETGDFIVRRRDGVPGFHLVSLIDDIDAGINFVVRGEDLLVSTAAQCHLSQFMKGSHFHESEFYHHPLIVPADGIKLSKSRNASPIKDLHSKWGGPEPIYRALSVALGLGSYNANGPDELLEALPANTRPQIEMIRFLPEEYADH